MHDRPVFEIDGQAFRWSDVVGAAREWGDWAACERAAAERIACLDHAAARDESLIDEEFEREEVAFRRARGLLAAEELTDWLDRRSISVGEWRDSLRGAVLRRRWSEQLDSIVAGGPTPDAAAWVEAVCSGTIDRVAQALAARLAVGPADALDLDAVEAQFQEFCRNAASPEAIEREIERHRLDWLQFEWRYLASGDEHVLREAALCVREDGMALAEVAAASGLGLEHRICELGEVEPELVPDLLGAQPGALLGPLAVASEYRLIELVDRRQPSVDEPRAVERARRNVVERAVQREVARRMRWLID